MISETYRGELARLLCGDALARPVAVRTRAGQWRRDPSAIWDWFYGLDAPVRAWITRELMADTGDYGCSPDDLATTSGCDDVNTWSAQLVDLVMAARAAGRSRDPLADDYADDDEGDQLMGPGEVAALLQVNKNTIVQWRRRPNVQFPTPDLVLSDMPIWRRAEIEQWARWSGREIVE